MPGVWALALAAVVLTGLVGAADRWLAYRQIDRQTRESLHRQARLLEDRIADHVRDINTILDEVIAETPGDGKPCNQELHERFGKLYPEFQTVALLDASGRIRCSSLPVLIGTDRSADERFRTVKAQPRNRVLLLARPTVSSTGEPVMLYAKARADALGALQAVALVTVRLDYYDRLLATLRDSEQGIVLAHGSGLVLSRLPDPQAHRLHDLTAGRSIFNMHRESGLGLFVTRAVAPIDGIDRYAATATVVPAQVSPPPAGHLVIGISEKAAKVFAPWWRQNVVAMGVWGLVALAVLALAKQLARRQEQVRGEMAERKKITRSLVATAGELMQHQDALDQHAIVSVADPAGNIIEVNDKFCDVSGYSRRELIGQNHRILNSGTHPPEFFRDMWRTIAGGKPWHGLICNRARDGRRYWVESSIVPMLDGDGRIDRYISIRTDVTALVQAQEEVRKSEADFRSIVENLQDVFYRTDRDGRVTLVSPSIEALLGYPAAELRGRPMAEKWLNPEERGAFLRQIEEGGGRISDYVARLRAKDGSTVWVSITAHHCRDRDGAIGGVEGIIHDITRRKKMEDALVAAKEEAEAANRAKSAFLSNMSHELRTPLNSILGFSQLLLGEGLPPAARSDVERIHKAGAHLLTLINEVLDLARIEAETLEIEVVPVDAAAVIGEALDMVRALAARHRIAMEWQPPAEAQRVRADSDRLKQALLNLLSNAIKYNRADGRVTVRIERSAEGRTRIRVSDTGIGMSPEQLRHAFTPFSRMGPKQVEGTGIGLAITRKLVELMGGAVGVDSSPEIGSSFWIELERAGPEAAPVAAPPANAPAGPAPAGCVLYVEDNPDNMRLVQKLLGRFPEVRLLTAAEPFAGLDLALGELPDLILLDINLPGIDGFEVLRRLRADAATRHIPVVAVSANAMPHDLAAGRAAGFDDYLTKPFRTEALLALVSRMLERRGGSTAAGRTAPWRPPDAMPPAPPAP